ncbi:MAG: hypothetical protein J6Y71_03785, partial [Ruminococcus sp.]|nr:hypothetical protein [Ruminococcus sp.]
MRKAIALFLPLTLLISTASCSQKNDSPDTPSVSSTDATTETASEQTEETATEAETSAKTEIKFDGPKYETYAKM